MYWPDFQFYGKQRDAIYSVRDSKETYLVSANKMGKDFLAGYVVLSFLLHPQMYFDPGYVADVNRRVRPGTNPLFVHTRRVVTTSVAERHLTVLWGEIGRYLSTCRFPLSYKAGGPLVVNNMELRFQFEMESKNPINYAVGMVYDNPDKMSGHHAAYTLFVGDEASGLDDVCKDRVDGWAKKYLIFGNPNPTANFFYRSVQAGDLLAQGDS